MEMSPEMDFLDASEVNLAQYPDSAVTLKAYQMPGFVSLIKIMRT